MSWAYSLEACPEGHHTLRAQFEADEFASQMGFGEELLDIMMDHTDNLEVQFVLFIYKSYWAGSD